MSEAIKTMPKPLSVIRAVSWVTCQEILRDKVLYNIILCSFLLFGIGFLASRLTFVRPERVLVDFGISALGISCAMIAAFTGAGLLGREFDRRTILVALSKPISRLHFVTGKFAGLSAVIAINWVLLTLSLSLIVWLSSGQTELILSGTFAWAVVLLLFQSLMLAGIAIFFSSFSTTSLAAIMTVGVYLIGNNISQVLTVASRVRTPWAASLLKVGASVLPNLEYFNLGTQVTYALPVSWSFGLTSILYALVLVAIALLASGVLIRRRES